jgi:hypothetical protein
VYAAAVAGAARSCRYDLFKKYAAVEQETAIAEEATQVLHGSRPAAPQHRNALQKLMGGEDVPLVSCGMCLLFLST